METRLAHVLQRQRILWGALLLTTVIYLAVAEYLGSTGQFPAGGLAPPLEIGLLISAAACAVGSLLLPRVLMAKAVAALSLPTTREADGGADGRLFRDAAATRIAFDDPPRARVAVANAMQAPFIVGLALTEAVALVGLMSAFLGATRAFAAGFWLIAWVLFATRFPTVARIDALIARYFGAPIA